jgi:hypothetical protein
MSEKLVSITATGKVVCALANMCDVDYCTVNKSVTVAEGKNILPKDAAEIVKICRQKAEEWERQPESPCTRMDNPRGGGDVAVSREPVKIHTSPLTS